MRGVDDLALELLGVRERRHVGLVGEVAVAVDQELRAADRADLCPAARSGDDADDAGCAQLRSTG